MKNILYTLCCTFLILTTAQGQNKDKQREVKIRFACTQVLDAQAAMIVVPGHTENIQLSTRYATKAFSAKLSKKGILAIYPKDTVIDKTSKPIGKVAIPKGIKKGLVLLFPQKDKYHGVFIKESSYPRGGIYMINTTKEYIRLKDGSKTTIIQPRKSHTYKAPNYGEAENKVLRVTMSSSTDNKKWHKFLSSAWNLIKGHREILILFKKHNREGVFFKNIIQSD